MVLHHSRLFQHATTLLASDLSRWQLSEERWRIEEKLAGRGGPAAQSVSGPVSPFPRKPTFRLGNPILALPFERRQPRRVSPLRTRYTVYLGTYGVRSR